MAELEAGGTQETEQAKGLDAILDAAIAQHTEEPEADTPAEPKSDGKQRDERGKFIAKDKSEAEAPVTGQAEVKDQTVTPETGTALEAQPVVLPDAWSADWKAKAATLPPDQQALLVEQYKAMQGDYTRKSQEFAQQRKDYEPLLSTVNKWNGYFQKVGMTPEKAFDYLVNAEYQLRTGTPTEKQAILDQLARDYGLQSNGQQNPVAHSQTDPAVAELKQRLSGLQDYIETTEQQKLKSEIDAFSQAKDQSGQLLRPHFERVRETMGRLLDSGQATDLDAAYAKAVRLDDDLFKQTVESERKRVTDEAERARQEAVDKAKKAQPTRSSDGNPSGAATRKGLDAHLDAALEQFGS